MNRCDGTDSPGRCTACGRDVSLGPLGRDERRVGNAAPFSPHCARRTFLWLGRVNTPPTNSQTASVLFLALGGAASCVAVDGCGRFGHRGSLYAFSDSRL
jgi:hypothetical protein